MHDRVRRRERYQWDGKGGRNDKKTEAWMSGWDGRKDREEGINGR